MLRRISAWSADHAKLVIAAWVIAGAALALWAPSLQKVGVQDETSFLPGGAPSMQANQLLQQLFPNDPTLQAGIVVLSRHGGLDAGDARYVAAFDQWLGHSGVSSDVSTVESTANDPTLASELLSEDHTAELLIVGFKSPPFTSRTDAAITTIRTHLDDTAPPGLSHELTGTAGLAADEASGLVNSFTQTAWITVLLVLLMLVFVYRSIVAPLIPLVSIGLAYLVSVGVVGVLAAHGFKVATLAQTFMLVMIFGAGTDYCLFIVSRYREHLNDSHDAVDAPIRRTMSVLGTVIVASALTVMAGFMSMLTARFGIYRTMGPALGVAVFITLVAALTLTPALMKVAGRFVFWPAPRSDHVRSNRSAARWQMLARRIKERPGAVLLAGVTVLLIPVCGLTVFRESFDLINDLPPSADARVGYSVLASHFSSGTVAPTYVVIDSSSSILTSERLTAIDHLTNTLRATAGVQQVRSLTQPAGSDSLDLTRLLAALPPTTTSRSNLLEEYPQLESGPLGFFVGKGATSTRIFVALKGDPYSRQSLPIVHRLDVVAAQTLASTALTGSKLEVGGPPATFFDMEQVGNRDFRVMSAVLMGGIFLVLALILRSLVAPFYLLASVVLSYAAALGLTSAVFDGLLHQAGISFWLPPFLFIILVALGADYNIFIMSRIREEADRGHPPAQAVEVGLVATGRVITSAGLILAGTFATLIFAPLPMLGQIGFGIGVGVLIDTFVVRTVVVPAATMLLGAWAFWPSASTNVPHTAKQHRRVGIAVGLGVASLTGALILLAVAAQGTNSITTVPHSTCCTATVRTDAGP